MREFPYHGKTASLKEDLHVGWGSTFTIPKGTKIRLIAATNLPSNSEFHYWASIVDKRGINPALSSWERNYGIPVNSSDFTILD